MYYHSTVFAKQLAFVHSFVNRMIMKITIRTFEKLVHYITHYKTAVGMVMVASINNSYIKRSIALKPVVTFYQEQVVTFKFRVFVISVGSIK